MDHGVGSTDHFFEHAALPQNDLHLLGYLEVALHV